MPLPKPPAKRADFLSRADFDSPAAPAPGQAHRATARERAGRAGAARAVERRHAAGGAAGRRQDDAGRSAGRTSRRRRCNRRRARAGRAATARPTLFVLDTNVLMHDPTSLFRFEEHDVYLPMITLEELDGHKKGMTEVARNARQVSRDLDALAANMPTRDAPAAPRASPLARTGHREAGGKLFFQTDADRRQPAAGPAAGQGRQPDPRRRARRCASSTRSATSCWCPRTSTCASRRVRSACRPRTTSTTRRSTTATCSTPACCSCPPTSGTRHGKTMESWQQGGLTYYRISGAARAARC